MICYGWGNIRIAGAGSQKLAQHIIVIEWTIFN